MTETVGGYDARVKKLPKKLREWPAFEDINTKVQDLQILIPLVSQLSKPSIKTRHWDEVNGLLLSVTPPLTLLPYAEETFLLEDWIKSNIIKFKEEVEEICDGADKQLSIEKKMYDLKEQWALASFEFAMWKNR